MKKTEGHVGPVIGAEQLAVPLEFEQDQLHVLPEEETPDAVPEEHRPLLGAEPLPTFAALPQAGAAGAEHPPV